MKFIEDDKHFVFQNFIRGGTPDCGVFGGWEGSYYIYDSYDLVTLIENGGGGDVEVIGFKKIVPANEGKSKELRLVSSNEPIKF